MKALACGVSLSMLVGVQSVLAAGLLIPADKALSPLAMQRERVEAAIQDGAATVRIEQVFRNRVDRDLEAVYVFALPPGAAVSEFAMTLDGTPVKGELLDADEARATYEAIVRRLKDPGLLEYLGGNLFKVRVFPVRANARQHIEITYSHVLEYDGGLYRFVYPAKAGRTGSFAPESFGLSARLHSSIPIRTVYSPSHPVEIDDRQDHGARIGYEGPQGNRDRDFELYYGVSKQDFGLNILTHVQPGEDGCFMMMAAPFAFDPDAAAMSKDVVFVIDTSGSMAGDKIKQARQALAYCIESLNPNDRFNVIRFSTDVDALAEELLAVSDDTRARALTFIDGLQARGGTAIDAALREALGMTFREACPGMVVFLTDGKPTVGPSQPEEILEGLATVAREGIRIFPFGIGDRINTHLLDRLAQQRNGFTQYVKPREELEVKLSAFADRISSPVLSDVEITVDGVEPYAVHPRVLPDVFAGDQLVLFGRYKGSGQATVALSGQMRDARREFVYDVGFAATNRTHAFIAPLWATRRIGFLLEEIRLHEREDELRGEVVRLSKAYGIVTPYTSYLVTEAETTEPLRARPPRPLPMPVPVRAKGQVHDDRSARRVAREFMARESGAAAVALSSAIRDYKQAEQDEGQPTAVRHVQGKTFERKDGRWVDQDYQGEMKTERIAFGSRPYFRWIEKCPELKAWFALGKEVTVVVEKGLALVVE